MPSLKRQFGDQGESEAVLFLSERGYRIIDRNYRIKNIGEIDLVGEKDNKVIFFEVKTRNNIYESAFPIQLSINKRKKRILRKICELYLLNKRGYEGKEWQLDGIFINSSREQKDKFRIEHLENILWEQYY